METNYKQQQKQIKGRIRQERMNLMKDLGRLKDERMAKIN